MTSRGRIAAAALVLAGTGVTGCSGSDPTVLERADEALGKLERGEFSVVVAARAGEADGTTSGPVGFDINGRFDVEPEPATRFPVLDMSYTRTLGDDVQTMAVKSDGGRIVVVTDGQPVEVPAEQASQLELATGDRPGGLSELGISGWITKPVESEGPSVDGVATRRVSGPVDAADLMSDLAVLASQLSGQDAPRLEGEQAEKVQSRVRSGEVEVLLDPNDLPRRVHATVDFGAEVAPELQEVLGPYAAAALEVTLEIRAPGAPVGAPSIP